MAKRKKVMDVVFLLDRSGSMKGIEKDTKRWYISPFPLIKAGNCALVEDRRGNLVRSTVLRIERVTAQTAPYPVKNTREICKILSE